MMIDGNNVIERISQLNKEILKENFWKDKNNSKKVLKEKNFLEKIFNFFNITEKEIKNLKDLNNLALEESDNPTLNDCSNKIVK